LSRVSFAPPAAGAERTSAGFSLGQAGLADEGLLIGKKRPAKHGPKSGESTGINLPQRWRSRR